MLARWGSVAEPPASEDACSPGGIGVPPMSVPGASRLRADRGLAPPASVQVHAGGEGRRRRPVGVGDGDPYFFFASSRSFASAMTCSETLRGQGA